MLIVVQQVLTNLCKLSGNQMMSRRHPGAPTFSRVAAEATFPKALKALTAFLTCRPA